MNVNNVRKVIISIIQLVFKMEIAPKKHSRLTQLVKIVTHIALIVMEVNLLNVKNVSKIIISTIKLVFKMEIAP
jgi:hypothetical protein